MHFAALLLLQLLLLPLLLLLLLPNLAAAYGAAPEPWLPLHGGAFSGAPQPFSPDPLVRYEWPLAATNDTLLQTYLVPAVACSGAPAAHFLNASSAVGSLAPSIRVTGSGSLTVDFGVELAAWVEFDSPDLLPADAASLVLGISEYNVVDYVGGFKQGRPVAYGQGCGGGGGGGGGGAPCTYRLETNSELYEGVRYAFLTLPAAPSAPFTITGLRAVAQAKPMNYVGAFAAAGDPALERVWWTAAYTVRATAQATYMGSILMDRGDRFSWTGDAHPSQATSLAAFANFAFVFNNLNRSKSDCQGIATYCLYFVLSVADYFEATGDAAGVRYLAPSVLGHLAGAAAAWENPQGLRFVGWDDRTGSGFANNTTPETQALYRCLAIRAFQAASLFLNASGANATAAALYGALAAARAADLRALPPAASPWYSAYGLHAAAEAVNTGFLTPAELAGLAATSALGDAVKLPSQSNFNQYFILQALSGLGQLDRGVQSIRDVWAPINDAGATTFWETSHPSAASIFPGGGPPPPAAEQSGWVSYCHPWASGPAPWLTRWVTGIRADAPGYASALLAPHIAHSMAGVAGRVGVAGGGAIALAVARGSALGRALVNVTLPARVARARLRLSSVLLLRATGLAQAQAQARAQSEAEEEAFLASFAFTLQRAPGAAGAGAGVAVQGELVRAPDAPLHDETPASASLSRRCAALEFELRSGSSGSSGSRAPLEEHFTLSIERRSVSGSGSPAPGAPAMPPWAPLASPFPPQVWPSTFLGEDRATAGSWRGVYGGAGYVLIGYDAPSTASDPFCASAQEGQQLQLECTEAGATIESVLFAAYGGAPGGACPHFAPGACAAPSSRAVASAACLGRRSCSLQVSNSAFGGDPCPGVPKGLTLVAHCSSGGGRQPGRSAPPADRAALPPWVRSARVVDYDGFCGARFNWLNASAAAVALADPAGAALPRHLGGMQPCGCPTAPFDVQLTDAAAAAGKRYRLSLYFADLARSPECSALDGSNRSQEVYLLTAYPDLSPATQRQWLHDFGGGVWWSYDVAGSVRVRISTIRGDMAVLSAVAFDELQ